MSLERGIPIASLGSTTWKRKDLLRGLEGDECYYIQREPLVRGKLHIDLDMDPPPDLVVEIDVTHNPIDRDAVYAALGVMEVWHYDGRSLRAAGLSRSPAARRYEPLKRSLAFPFLDPQAARAVYRDAVGKGRDKHRSRMARAFKIHLTLRSQLL